MPPVSQIFISLSIFNVFIDRCKIPVSVPIEILVFSGNLLNKFISASASAAPAFLRNVTPE